MTTTRTIPVIGSALTRHRCSGDRFSRSLGEAFNDAARAGFISGPYRREPLIFRRVGVTVGASLVLLLAACAVAALKP